MPSISHASRSFFILAWAFKFSKFSVLERNCIRWIWSKQKLICEERIYLHIYKSVIMQLVSVFITSHLYTVFFCFSTPAFCLGRDCYVVFKMCQEIMTRSVFLLLQFGTYGTDFTTFFLLHCESRKHSFHPWTGLWRLPSSWKENNFSVCCYCLFLLVLMHVPTHTSEDAG